MKFESIADCFEYLRDGYSYSEALLDCINANNLSITDLEQHFSNWLWVSEDSKPYEGADLEYAIQLGKIEELLCENSLIYND